MKKILLTLVIMTAVLFSYANTPFTVSEKVLKVFSTTFPGVEDAKWYEYETFYEAYFDKDDIKCRVRFDLEGKILNTIRYYGEKTVSPFLKAKIAQKYPGKKIFGVTEVNDESE
ncbi:MAG: hypothetical protein EOO10_08185, partial [Chitinophagaceae bacterium]